MSLHPLPERQEVGAVAHPDQPAVIFRRENVKNIWSETLPLIAAHWAEIAHYKDIPLDPDYEFYLKADELGMLRVYAAREMGELVGYCVYFVKPSPHYKKTIYALQDVLFLRKDRRRGRLGLKFVNWCDEQLAREGVHVVMQHIKAAHNFGPALARVCGYELQDVVYSKRLK